MRPKHVICPFITRLLFSVALGFTHNFSIWENRDPTLDLYAKLTNTTTIALVTIPIIRSVIRSIHYEHHHRYHWNQSTIRIRRQRRLAKAKASIQFENIFNELLWHPQQPIACANEVLHLPARYLQTPPVVRLILVMSKAPPYFPTSRLKLLLTSSHPETAIMGISRDSRHKRSASGAKRAYYRA